MNAIRGAHYGIASLVMGGLLVLQAGPVAASLEGRVAAARVSEENYRHYLDDMLYTHAGDDRSVTGPEHDPARDNIQTLLTSFGLTVTLESFVYDYPEPDTVYYNVVATKLGTTYPDQEYIIGAHYDSGFVFSEHGKLPQFAEPYASYQGTPGADDNASGVALVLEAARILSQYDSDYTIRFIAFDAEEIGLVGSEAYVADHIGDDILGMISTDMVAYNNGANSADIFCTDPSEPVKSSLAQAIDAYGYGLSYQLGPGHGGSDHWPFEQAGFHACLLIEDWGNPNYHTPEDNVDEPDYIDYAYATRMTRSIIGYLVDNAGVHVDIPDADYDGDGDVDEDDSSAFIACFTGADTPPVDPDCYFFDFDSDGDIDCTDWDVFVAVWTGPPVDPPMFLPCSTFGCYPSTEPTLEELNGGDGTFLNRKNRYISVRSNDPGQVQAIRVVLGPKDAGRGNIPPPFEIWAGQAFYAGEPRPYCENAGQGLSVRPDEGTGCGQAPGVYENEQIWFWAAPLVCDAGAAHFMDWTTLADYCNTPGAPSYDAHPCMTDADCGGGTCGVSDVVHLFHEGIVPSHMASGAGPIDTEAVYEVSVIDITCPMDDPGAYSVPVQLHQAGWGDVVLNVADCPNWPPEESVGVVTDVVALLNKFSNNNCAVQKTRADLMPCQVDFNVSISDVVGSLSGFVGGDYEDTCGSGQCSELGMCKGGPDHGVPCTNDNDCDSDVCAGKSGFTVE